MDVYQECVKNYIEQGMEKENAENMILLELRHADESLPQLQVLENQAVVESPKVYRG